MNAVLDQVEYSYRRAALRRTKIGIVPQFGQLGGAVAGFLLRNQPRDALDPENLRAA